MEFITANLEMVIKTVLVNLNGKTDLLIKVILRTIKGTVKVFTRLNKAVLKENGKAIK